MGKISFAHGLIFLDHWHWYSTLAAACCAAVLAAGVGCQRASFQKQGRRHSSWCSRRRRHKRRRRRGGWCWLGVRASGLCRQRGGCTFGNQRRRAGSLSQRQGCDITYDITMWYHTVISYMSLPWYHMWYHGVMWKNEYDITYDVPLFCLWFHMWYHSIFLWYHIIVISHCDITMWHHIWYYAFTSHDIHLWHHIWYHSSKCDIIVKTVISHNYDIIVWKSWYHSMIS